jgi:hypothetical protein
LAFAQILVVNFASPIKADKNQGLMVAIVYMDCVYGFLKLLNAGTLKNIQKSIYA